MQSHAVTPAPTQEAQTIPLAFTKEHFETLKEIYDHLGTISFNGTTIPSPLLLALKTETKIDIAEAQVTLRCIIQAREVQERTDVIKDTCLGLYKHDHEFLTKLICRITELSIKHHGNFAQFLEKPINIAAVSALFVELSYTTLKAHKNMLVQMLTHIQGKTKAEMHAMCPVLTNITSEVDGHLATALTISREFFSQLTDKINDCLLKLLGLGYDFYTLLERAKVEFVEAKINTPITRKFTASHFLDKLTENQRLKFNPSLELDALYARYQHLHLHTNNIKNLDNAYNHAQSRISEHYKNGAIDEAYFHEATYPLSVTQIQMVFERCNDSIHQNDLDSARKLMFEIERLFKQINLSNINPLKTGTVDHHLFSDFFTLALKNFVKRGLNTSASNIDSLLNDIQQVKRILNLYKHTKQNPPNCEATVKVYDIKITLIEENTSQKKQAILVAEANAIKLSEELDKKIKQYDEEFQKILDALTNDTKEKIKKKPKVIRPAIAVPKAATHEAIPEQQTLDPYRGMPDRAKESLADQAAAFFESNDYRDYPQFINQQTQEDRAEALLYAADYCLLAKSVGTAIQLYEESYTLAKQENPLNVDLIANLKLSLTITYEHIEVRLAQTKAREDRLNQSREQFIMYLGYYCAANDPEAVSASKPHQNQGEYHKHIHELGLACFKNIGREKQALNIPLSSYSKQREFIAKEMKRLTELSENTQQVLDTIEGKPASALQQHSHFKTKQSPSLPSKKMAPGAAKRRAHKRK